MPCLLCATQPPLERLVQLIQIQLIHEYVGVGATQLSRMLMSTTSTNYIHIHICQGSRFKHNIHPTWTETRLFIKGCFVSLCQECFKQ